MAEADQQQQSLRAPPISEQPPSPFLQFPGDPPVEWSRWYHACETYLLAAGLDALSDRRNKALLEHCLGTEGQRVLATLDVPQQQPANDEQQPAEAQQYQRIVSELTAHFGTQATVITERHRFRQRSQAAGENIKQYVSALRQLAARCQLAFFVIKLFEINLSKRKRLRQLGNDFSSKRTICHARKHWKSPAKWNPQSRKPCRWAGSHPHLHNPQQVTYRE